MKYGYVLTCAIVSDDASQAKTTQEDNYDAIANARVEDNVAVTVHGNQREQDNSSDEIVEIKEQDEIILFCTCCRRKLGEED